MQVVRLQYLVAREGGWAAQAEWGETLSLGAAPPLPMGVAFILGEHPVKAVHISTCPSSCLSIQVMSKCGASSNR